MSATKRTHARMRMLRVCAGVAVLVCALASFHFDMPVGTLCSFCLVGFLQVAAAARSIPWDLLPCVIAALLIVVVFGRAFCSWLCPTALLKNVFGGHTPRGLIGRAGKKAQLPCATSAGQAAGECAGQASCRSAGQAAGAERLAGKGAGQAAGECAGREAFKGSESHASCAAQGFSFASQAIVLAVLMAVSFAVRFPVFCLVCPIGLVFGTLWAVNRVFMLLQPGWELVVFPLMLLVEVFFFKRWCSSVCPFGFFFGLIAKAREKLGLGLRLKANCETCLSREGCSVCSTVCAEDIAVSSCSSADRQQCTFCLDCKEQCPAKAIEVTAKRS